MKEANDSGFARTLLLFTVTMFLLGGKLALFLVAGTLVVQGGQSTSAAPPRDAESIATSVPPVKVKVLDEALCGGCKEFVNTQLSPVYQSLGATVIDLQVIPFGNARYIPDDKDPAKQVLDCQHGKAECDANSWEQCVAILLYPYPPRYLPFIDCLYKELPMSYSDEIFDRGIFADCARQAALDFETIAQCHDDEYQAGALQQVAFALTPDYHDYVPWIEINGEHVELEDDTSFLKAVCKAYTESGGTHPYCEPGVLSSL